MKVRGRCTCVYGCANVCVGVCVRARGTVCSCLSAFAERGERIWQACLLSLQNNCLWITWGESHWRYLEMTLPGDSSNHVHIRSERGFDFALPLLCASPCVSCVCMCCAWSFADPRRYVVSFIWLTHKEVIPHTQNLHMHSSIIHNSAQLHVVTDNKLKPVILYPNGLCTAATLMSLAFVWHQKKRTVNDLRGQNIHRDLGGEQQLHIIQVQWLLCCSQGA